MTYGAQQCPRQQGKRAGEQEDIELDRIFREFLRQQEVGFDHKLLVDGAGLPGAGRSDVVQPDIFQ